MATVMYTFPETKTEDGKYQLVEMDPVFAAHDYRVYAFLGGVRNSFGFEPVFNNRRLPVDASPQTMEQAQLGLTPGHSASWVAVKELAGWFDYDQPFENLHGPKDTVLETDKGVKTTFGAFLGDEFFADVRRLEDAGVERVIFWFEN